MRFQPFSFGHRLPKTWSARSTKFCCCYYEASEERGSVTRKRQDPELAGCIHEVWLACLAQIVNKASMWKWMTIGAAAKCLVQQNWKHVE